MEKVNFSDCNFMQFLVSKNFFVCLNNSLLILFFSLKAEVRNNWTTERFDEFLSKENFFQTIVKPAQSAGLAPQCRSGIRLSLDSKARATP